MAEYRVQIGQSVRAKLRWLPSAQISKVTIIALLDALEERERIIERIEGVRLEAELSHKGMDPR
jgi:hypothetical protein